MIERCTRCDRKLNPKRIVWLELSFITGKYYEINSGMVPDNESQGAFPFGPDCARATLSEQTSEGKN